MTATCTRHVLFATLLGLAAGQVAVNFTSVDPNAFGGVRVSVCVLVGVILCIRIVRF
jgi:hypothetical protein